MSPMLLSYRLAEFLPFENGAKQAVLETDDAGERLELIKTNLMSLEVEFENAVSRAH